MLISMKQYSAAETDGTVSSLKGIKSDVNPSNGCDVSI